MPQCPQCHAEIHEDDPVCLSCLTSLRPVSTPPADPRAVFSPLEPPDMAAENGEPAALPTPVGDGVWRAEARRVIHRLRPSAEYVSEPPAAMAPNGDDAGPAGRRPFSPLAIVRALVFLGLGITLLLLGVLMGHGVATQAPATPSPFDDGMALYQAGDFQAASYVFGVVADAALARSGAVSARALVMAGWSAYRLGDYAHAADRFIAAAGQDGDNAEAYAGLGLTYLAQERLSDAREALTEAVALSDVLPAAHRGFGLLALAEKLPDRAVSELSRAVALAPDDAENRIALGRALASAGRYEEAIQELEPAAAGAPTAPYLDALIECYWAVGRYTDAVTVAQGRALAEPARAQWQYDCGQALWRAGRVPEAQAAFLKTLTLNPPADLAGSALRMVGVTLAQQERYAEAMEPLGRAIALRPDDAAALAELGWALARLGRCAEGVEDFTRARRAAPDLAAAIEGEKACRQWLGQTSQ